MAPRRKASSPPEILSASYLEGARNKNDLLKRLKNIGEQLSDEDVEPNSPHYPGLASLATSLVSVSDEDDTAYIYLNHKDKDVRLHSVLACMELFYIYAPEPPWNEDEIIEIFQQMIRQLGNLATCIPNEASMTQVHQYEAYFRILEQLSEVKIGVVLVDLIRTEQAPHALETLCELIKTILTCVHVDHPPEVGQHAEAAVAACVEEFEGNIPNAVLDELLLPVGSGPVTYVIDPKSKENPPAQIQQTNPSYLVAAKVLRKTEDKIASPIANLLNGIFSGDPKILESTSLSAQDLTESPPSAGKKKKKKGGKETSSPTLNFAKEVSAGDVYSIAYELHRITPMILTTVIGTVASDLTNTDVDKRWQATKLLGRLFAARSSDIARRFRPCFRDWLRRSYDPEGSIREMMIRSLTNFLSTQHAQTELCEDVTEALSVIIKMDKITEIRIYAIHQVCELAHSATSRDDTESGQSSKRRAAHPISVVSADLLNAVGTRVSSKFKTERKDAITGLAKIYYKHYITKKLQYVQEGGDDVNIDEILDVFSKENLDQALEEKFNWIPQKVFESVFFSDEQDPDLRSRIFQIVDDIMLGTEKKDGAMLSPTSRAVGLAMILQTLQNKDSAKKWMCALFSHRSNMQRSLASYLEARSKARECESGSAEAFTADADAMEKLEKFATLCAPPLATGKNSSDEADLENVLRKLHAAKDRHIFRIMSTIASPTHSNSARLRALDELPKRTKSLGSATSSWVRSMTRRCAMGSFINSESVEHCIMLSQECFEAGDCEAASHFLRCVKMAMSIFPALGGSNDGFENLAEFFDASRTTEMTSAMKRDMEKYGIVTMISDILAKAAPSRSGKKGKDTNSIDTLRTQLHRTCTREGTPEQARNAVYAIAAIMNPRSKPITDLSVRARKEENEFGPILKALVSPSRLSIPDDDVSSKNKERIISVLTAITAIAECAPYAFNASGEGSKLGWGERAIKFALDTALLGRNNRLDTSRDDDSSDDSDSDDESAKKGGRKKGSKKKKSGVSVHCQMMCEAIELLVTHIRSTIVGSRRTSNDAVLEPPSSEYITEVFNTLSKILEDQGVPPSSVNGRYCNTSQDRATLRRSAAINLLRLCDSGLKLEDKYLTSKMWHMLSNVLLDESSSVRDAVAEELSFMLSGTGKYRHSGAGSAPSMRFIAFVTLCAESRKGGKVKTSMMQCISSLRGSIAQCQAQVRAMGKAAERNFENNLKKKLMPEYCVPYALHLLAFRQETVSAAGTLAGEGESDDEMETEQFAQSEEASEKRLKKRLKFLFDPLIQSLGERADNISFLLRMIDQIGKFSPVDVTKSPTKSSSLETSLDDDDSEIESDSEEKEAAARMKIICQFAREVLLSHVKKDHNLTVYPGSIQVPAALYSRNQTSPTTIPLQYESDDSFEAPVNKKPKKSISHYVKKNEDMDSEDDKSEDDKSVGDESIDDNPMVNEEQADEDEVDFGNDATDNFSPDMSDSEQNPEKEEPVLSPEKDEEEPSADFDTGLGDISPIAKDVSPLANPPSSSPAKKRAPRAKASKKRKSTDIDIFEDELSSPATDVAHSPKLSSKRRKSTTAASSTSAKKKKSKATPVSAKKKAMITITNSQSSSSSIQSTKKRGRKKQSKKDADESFDFPDSPPQKAEKKKASTAGRSRKKSPAARKKVSAKKMKVSASSPSTTSEASSRASRDRASRAMRRRALA